jgi:hypothetical protein
MINRNNKRRPISAEHTVHAVGIRKTIIGHGDLLICKRDYAKFSDVQSKRLHE